jgi:hypothetical protein
MSINNSINKISLVGNIMATFIDYKTMCHETSPQQIHGQPGCYNDKWIFNQAPLICDSYIYIYKLMVAIHLEQIFSMKDVRCCELIHMTRWHEFH